MESLVAFFSRMAVVIDGAAAQPGELSSLTDAEVLEAQRAIADCAEAVNRKAALCSAEIAHRSARRLGREGLAWRQGHTNTGELIRSVTGLSKREASALLSIGEMIDATESADRNARLVAENPEVTLPAEACTRPWFAALADAVKAGTISVAVANSIRRGLGEPTPVRRAFGVAPVAAEQTVTAEQLAAALPGLIRACEGLDPDRAWRSARNVRDDLDTAGLLGRSEAARDERYWRMSVRPSGMVAGSFLLDPEDGAMIKSIFDQATHPKTKGTSRWVSDDELARRRRVEGDDRSTDQVAADSLVELLRAGVAAVGTGLPAAGNGLVRVLVTEPVRARLVDDAPVDGGTPVDGAHGVPGPGPIGFGALDGADIAVPVQTVQRHLCEGSIEVVFGADGHPIDVSAEDRLFSRRQKIAMIARDGGCRWPGCDRPGEWSEAHHILHHKRDHGPTVVRNGIMLCRRHHLLLHNHHWEIVHAAGGGFALIPPADADPARRPIAMPSKSRIGPPPIVLPPPPPPLHGEAPGGVRVAAAERIDAAG